MRFVLGDLLEANVEALVNTVNIVGVMGKGIALQMKRAFPDNYKEYRRICDEGRLKPGEVFVYRLDRLDNPRYIFNVATKQHWRGNSRMEWVEAGLHAIRKEVHERGIRSIAIPPLGAGHGGLHWSHVKKAIEKHLAGMDDVEIQVFTPREEALLEQPVATKKPQWTLVRAYLVAMIDGYKEPGYRLGRLELQKLAYLLESAGAPLDLRFKPHKFGPYSDRLVHAVDAMEGHYIRGFGDRSGRSAVWTPKAVAREAKALLRHRAEAGPALNVLNRAIEGFESPYGLELLTSLHWLMREQPATRRDPQAATEALWGWTKRKRDLFPREHIELAHKHLRQHAAELGLAAS